MTNLLFGFCNVYVYWTSFKIFACMIFFLLVWGVDINKRVGWARLGKSFFFYLNKCHDLQCTYLILNVLSAQKN